MCVDTLSVQCTIGCGDKSKRHNYSEFFVFVKAYRGGGVNESGMGKLHIVTYLF